MRKDTFVKFSEIAAMLTRHSKNTSYRLREQMSVLVELYHLALTIS